MSNSNSIKWKRTEFFESKLRMPVLGQLVEVWVPVNVTQWVRG
jgi:hypothetical protein